VKAEKMIKKFIASKTESITYQVDVSLQKTKVSAVRLHKSQIKIDILTNGKTILLLVIGRT
jgi:hypothetical protein